MSTKKLSFTLIFLIHLLNFASYSFAQEPQEIRRYGLVDAYVNPAEATTVGATWSRIQLRWDVVQAGGASDWKPANLPDPLLDNELATGREVVAVLIGTPSWATESGSSTAMPPTELWAEFVFKIANQYKGRVNRWIIWNQPDVTDPTSPNYTWDGTPENYYILLKEAYLKIKAVDPTMQVHLAGLTARPNQKSTEFLEQLLDLIIADPDAVNQNYFFDVVSYHVYYDPYQMTTLLPEVKNLLAKYGLQDKPIWINETNAPPSNDSLEPLNTPPVFNITLAEQSAYIIQSHALALAAGADRIAVNKLRNETSAPIPYGLLRADNSHRPAFKALQLVTTHFQDIQDATWQKIDPQGIYLVTLNQGEQTTTILWNSTRETTDFTLNSISPQAILIDEQGNQQSIAASSGSHTVSLPGAICSHGDYCFIGGAPRILIEAGNVSLRTDIQPAIVTQPESSTNSETPSRAATPTIIPTNIPPALPPTATPASMPTVTEVILDTPTPTVRPTTITVTPNIVLPDPYSGPEETPPDAIDVPVGTPTPIPQVTIFTILTPDRLLWLFLIGLLVFTISYGIQVVIWYRFRG
ncbi:hypothetical protein QUF58_08115 [Anaerolineales bacterium HSG24]|nr:hypothetical protein [Anaerolineales bacterium HSG24]